MNWRKAAKGQRQTIKKKVATTSHIPLHLFAFNEMAARLPTASTMQIS